jgi:hypothetical protein
MQSQTKRSTRPSVSTPTRKSISKAPAAGVRRRTPPVNAFSAAYLEEARLLEEPPFQREALFAGPWEVEAVAAGDGEMHAVVRKGDPIRPPSDNDRAADASDLKSAEIEELLAAAMADIPTAAKESKSKTAVAPPAEPGKPTPNAASPSATALTVSTRPGGAKASEVASDSHPDIVADRLFWMSRSQSN